MKKVDSTFEPDFCAQKLKDNPWIVQPLEKYEEIRIEILKRVRSKGPVSSPLIIYATAKLATRTQLSTK